LRQVELCRCGQSGPRGVRGWTSGLLGKERRSTEIHATSWWVWRPCRFQDQFLPVTTITLGNSLVDLSVVHLSPETILLPSSTTLIRVFLWYNTLHHDVFLVKLEKAAGMLRKEKSEYEFRYCVELKGRHHHTGSVRIYNPNTVTLTITRGEAAKPKPAIGLRIHFHRTADQLY